MGHNPFNAIQRREHGQHRTRIAHRLLGHQLAPQPRQCKQILHPESPGSGQGGKFPVTVPGERIRVQSEPLVQHPPRPEADGADRRLRDFRGSKGGFVARLRVRHKTSRRVEMIREPTGIRLVTVLGSHLGVRVGQRVEHLGEQAGQFAQHADVLRPLTGEQHAKLAGRPGAEVGAILCIRQCHRFRRQFGFHHRD